MKSKLPKRYLFIPIIYIVLILVFINLHIQDLGGRNVVESVGPITVRYRQESGVRRQLSRVEVSLNGLSVDLSSGVPVEDSTGRSDQIPVTAVETTQKGFSLILARGGSIEFSVNRESGGCAVLYLQDAKEGDEFTPIISFTTPPQMDVRPVHRALPLIELSNEEKSVLLVHNNSLTPVEEGFRLSFAGDEKGRQLSYSALSKSVEAGDAAEKTSESGSTDGGADGVTDGPDSESGQRVFAGFVTLPIPAGTEPLPYWFFRGREAISAADAEVEVRETIEAMLRKWRGSPEEADAQIVAAYAAESMRDQSSVSFGPLQRAADEAAEDASWYTSTFANNIVNAEEAYAQREAQFIQEISRLLDESPERLLFEVARSTKYPEFLQSIIFYGDEELAGELDLVLGELDYQSFDSSVAVAGLFVLAVEALDKYPEVFPVLAGSAPRIFEKVLANSVNSDSQLLYPSLIKSIGVKGGPELVVDPLVQLKAARALQRYGDLYAEGAVEASQDEERAAHGLAALLGNSLLYSALAFRDEGGALPAELTASGEGLVPSDSSLSAAEVYPFLADNKFFPRVVSLKKELDKNIRLWTSAQAVGSVQRTNGFEITLDFAAGETHFLVIRGVDPFESMQMYGQRWNGDWRFQNYNVGGWFYDREKRTVYMKIRHREKVERITFLLS